MTNLPDISNTLTKSAVQNAANTFVPIQWADEVLAEREKKLFAARFFKRFNHVGKKGDTIRIPLITRTTPTDRTAGAALVPAVAAEGKIDVVIDKDKYIYRFYDKFIEMQSKYDLRAEYTKTDGYSMAEVIDTDILALFNAGLPAAYKVIGADGVTQYNGSNRSDITDACILACMKALLNNNVNLDECAWFIPPSQYTAMLAIDKFVLFQYSGEKRVMTGDIGQIYGIPVKVTNNCTTLATGDLARVAVLAHKDSVCSVVQRNVTVEAQYKIEYQAWGVAQTSCYGVKGLRLDADNTSSSNHRLAEAIAVYVP